ncbi:MAG: hypothetical protein AAFN09_17330 [Pseudomonadota bacterium]
MRLFDYLAYLVALIFYLPRLLLFWLYRSLLFISKPGSLYILPALLGGLMYWQYELIRTSFVFDWWVNDVIQPFAPHSPALEDYYYLGAFWGLFTFALYLLTGGKFQILGTVLSSLPQMRRPFPPSLRLRLVEKKIRPASVTLAVPALKRRRNGRHAPDVAAGLSEPLQRLLAPPVAPEPVSAPTEPETPATPPETPTEAEESAPVPEAPAMEGAEARPSRKPPPPPLPPKAEA